MSGPPEWVDNHPETTSSPRENVAKAVVLDERFVYETCVRRSTTARATHQKRFDHQLVSSQLPFAPSALIALLAAACSKPSEPRGGAASAAASAAAAPSTRAPENQPLAGERVEIPAGKLVAGSVPGEIGRDPEIEPRAYSVELGPFHIDRLPFPNDPAARPLTGVTRDEAKKHCRERGGRLCTELEWERACKGNEAWRYAGGDAWDERCAKAPASCASSFDVLAMGALREWVASDVIPRDATDKRRAVVRGAPPDAPAEAHRCAQRRTFGADSRADDLGFRCCKGPPNAAVIREPVLGQTFVKASLTAARIEKLLAQHPRTAALARDVKLFREPEAAETVVSRGPGDRKGFGFTVTPLRWNPVAGSELLLVAARSGDDTSFVVAYHVLGEDRYELASSFVMHGEPGPVAFAYDNYIRPRLHFSTCWGCPGETGKILHRPPDGAVILQP
jgi:formylglycine-generating enzyme required for sulfatase activity